MLILRRVMQVNAASCLGFGGLFAIAPASVAAFLGTVPVWLVLMLGVGLLINGGHLLWSARAETPLLRDVIWFSVGDIVWFLGSLLLLAGQIWVSTPMGVALCWAVAWGVAMLGLTQLWLLGQSAAGHSAGAHLRAILRSWLGMKLWVKLWLFFLNGVFLWAFTLIPSDFARITLIGYVACLPIILGVAFYQGGLTKAAGWGHLIPWLPMFAWWLADGIDTPYKAVLVGATVLCLAFDVYDALRFHRGDRALIGTAVA